MMWHLISAIGIIDRVATISTKGLHMIRKMTIAVFLAGLLALMSQPNLGDAAAATQMPSFELEDVVTGDPIASSRFEGKSLLITFWATWCPPLYPGNSQSD